MFEPFLPTFARLKANLQENDFDQRAKAVQAAVGNSTGVAHLAITEDKTMCALTDDADSIEVPVVRLTKLCQWTAALLS